MPWAVMEQPLTRNDHLEFGEAQHEEPRRHLVKRGTSSRFPLLTEDENPHGDDGKTLLSVGQLQSKDLSKIFYDGLFISAAYVVAGGAWFMASSEWSFTTTVYFMVTSFLTIGYGDVTVRRRSIDRIVDSLLILVGLAAIGVWAAYAERASEVLRLRGDSGDDALQGFQAEKGIKRDRHKLIWCLFWMFVIITIGNLVFMWGEGVCFTSSFYWAIVTASTIGYGDVVPTTTAMKWFTIFYSIFATVWMVETLRVLGRYPFRIWSWRAQAKVFNQFARDDDPEERRRVSALAEHAVLASLGRPAERRGRISRSEFSLSMLLLLDRISYKDYQEVATVFDTLGLEDDAETGVPRARAIPVVGVE